MKKEANLIANLWRHTWKHSKGNRGNIVVFGVLFFVGNILFLLEPIVIARIFNSVQFSDDPRGLLFSIIQNLLLLFVLLVAGSVLHHSARVLETTNAYLVRKNYKNDLFKKTLDLPIEWHKNRHSGETIDKVNKASGGLFDFSGSLFLIIENGMQMIGSIVALAFFDISAFAVAAAVSIVAVSSILQFDKKLKPGYAEEIKYENRLASALHDYFNNIFTIITLKFKDRASTEVDSRAMAGLPVYRRNWVINEVKWFSITMLISVMIVGVLILNAYRSYTSEGVIVLGTLFVLFTYLQNVGHSFYRFTSLYGQFIPWNAAVLATEEIEHDYAKLREAKEYSLPRSWQKLEIKNLNFTYHKEADHLHLDNVNLEIRRGERIALVGSSGSGKSTTLALLRGLYQPQSASLLSDGQALEGSLGPLYDHVTLIPQDPEIFNSTVEDNITMDTKVSSDELDNAIDMAQFRSVLERLPQGLQTNVLEKGVSLSGGEKQRLALARGVLAAKDSEFIFMDEPTSSVDPVNETKIYDNIFGKFKDKTIVSTIHRLHLLQKFDRIYLFENGKVIASGVLEDVMQNNVFRELWDSYQKEAGAPIS